MAATRDVNDMRGPMAMAVAILAFGASMLLAVHLRYLPDAPTIAVLASGASHVPATLPSVSAVPAVPVEPSAAPEGAASDLTGLLDLGVVLPVPMPAAFDERERRLNECIERNVHGRGYGDVKPTLPGRWPALKRAREERRLRRLDVRAACEQELAH